jgi:hypothetical protein
MNVDNQGAVHSDMDQWQQFVATQVQQHTAPLQNNVTELEVLNQQLQQESMPSRLDTIWDSRT